jgi:ribosomal protein L40E
MIVIKRFDSLLEAAEFAATLCKSWSFAIADERYDTKHLLALAETSDSEDPIDEDSFFVVSTTGAIGLCQDGEDIDWLFLSDAVPNEDFPLIYKTTTKVKFCRKCDSAVAFDARFCAACGEKLV